MNNSEQSQQFSISRINSIKHVAAIILTVMLCFSLFMSELSHFNHSHQFSLINKMTPIYILLIGFAILMAIKSALAVKKVRISKENIEIHNLFWHENLVWSELEQLQAPKNLGYSWLKSKHFFYLFIKNEFENYMQLETLMAKYLAIKS
jgi:hypothetical protein